MSMEETYSAMVSFCEKGLPREALSIGEKAITIIEKGVNKNNLVHWVNVLCLMAKLLRSAEEFDRGEALYRKALSLEQEYLEKDAPMIGETLNNLSCHYAAQHKHKEAGECLERSIHIRMINYGDNSPQLLIPLTNMISLYSQQRRYDESVATAYKALDICCISGEGETEKKRGFWRIWEILSLR